MRPTVPRCIISAFISATAVAAFSGLATPHAGTDCALPTVTFDPRDTARGQTITVTGRTFGDNCYDSGAPPAGQGVLGRPIDDIEVVLQQASSECAALGVTVGFVVRHHRGNGHDDMV